jgi:putative tryptophan/tyrosine transport system substrate-binding protein
MTANTKRRDFITLLGGAVAAWPLAAIAQQPAMPVIGYLEAGLPEASANLVAAFRKGLSEHGYVEGRNVAIEFRWAYNENERLPELVADLVHRRVQIIVVPVSTPAAIAAKNATTTIPIVFGTGADPVRAGLVASLNRPGGNLTGAITMSVELMPKRIGLVNDLLPGATRFAVLINPTNPFGTEPAIADVQAAAVAIGREIEVLKASSNREIDTAFGTLVQKRTDAVVFTPDALFDSRRVQLAILAARYQLPALHWKREFAEVGGLMSYGSNVADVIRQAGTYTGRILKGERPADLPILRPTKFELVINLQTARTFGTIVPPTLLAGADEVIE